MTKQETIPQNRDNLEAMARVDAGQATTDRTYEAAEDFYREQRDYRYAGALNAMMTAATNQARTCSQRGLANGPIFRLLPVNRTSGTTANDNCKLNTTWLRISNR